MHDSAINPRASTVAASISEVLFAWRGGGIVLIGSHEEGRWVLARGWLQGDQLQHIRRWYFKQPILFSGQVRRLITEADCGAALAREEGLRALVWAESSRA